MSGGRSAYHVPLSEMQDAFRVGGGYGVTKPTALLNFIGDNHEAHGGLPISEPVIVTGMVVMSEAQGIVQYHLTALDGSIERLAEDLVSAAACERLELTHATTGDLHVKNICALAYPSLFIDCLGLGSWGVCDRAQAAVVHRATSIYNGATDIVRHSYGRSCAG